MSKTNIEPEKLRPELHQRLDHMDADQLELLQHIRLKLELDQVVGKLHESFESIDAARRSGALSRVDEIIREVRAEHPYAWPLPLTLPEVLSQCAPCRKHSRRKHHSAINYSVIQFSPPRQAERLMAE